MGLPTTAHRVEWNTSGWTNDAIRRRALKQVIDTASKENWNRRLRRLDREWDTERVLETNAACLMLASLGLGVLHDRRWLWLTGGVAAFLLQHAIQGWCPPLPVIRALGVRTAGEINRERMAVKAMRGDFEITGRTPETALLAAELD